MNQESISLNKYISQTGYCSRRQADELIDTGRVKINDTIARKGNRVVEGDKVTIDNRMITNKKPDQIYIALNKPVGIVCTTDDREPDNIIKFLGFKQRIFPIGRLDKMSEGLIILSNDGSIVNKILKARNHKEKEYIVTVNKRITPEFIRAMETGVPILDTVTRPCKLKATGEKSFHIIITQGLNRQIRRMCEYLGYRVKTLKRIRIMDIHLGNLPYGEWRHLTKSEISKLKKPNKREN